jgi:hypothetical protein
MTADYHPIISSSDQNSMAAERKFGSEVEDYGAPSASPRRRLKKSRAPREKLRLEIRAHRGFMANGRTY